VLEMSCHAYAVNKDSGPYGKQVYLYYMGYRTGSVSAQPHSEIKLMAYCRVAVDILGRSAQ
jgi:hypothetical protein